MLLGAGGSQNLEPYNFSANVHALLEEIGVDLDALNAACDPDFMLSNLHTDYGLHLNREQYGESRAVDSIR